MEKGPHHQVSLDGQRILMVTEVTNSYGLLFSSLQNPLLILLNAALRNIEETKIKYEVKIEEEKFGKG